MLNHNDLALATEFGGTFVPSFRGAKGGGLASAEFMLEVREEEERLRGRHAHPFVDIEEFPAAAANNPLAGLIAREAGKNLDLLAEEEMDRRQRWAINQLVVLGPAAVLRLYRQAHTLVEDTVLHEESVHLLRETNLAVHRAIWGGVLRPEDFDRAIPGKKPMETYREALARYARICPFAAGILRALGEH